MKVLDCRCEHGFAIPEAETTACLRERCQKATAGTSPTRSMIPKLASATVTSAILRCAGLPTSASVMPSSLRFRIGSSTCCYSDGASAPEERPPITAIDSRWGIAGSFLTVNTVRDLAPVGEDRLRPRALIAREVFVEEQLPPESDPRGRQRRHRAEDHFSTVRMDLRIVIISNGSAYIRTA